MNYERLTKETFNFFKIYCKRYLNEVDTSFLDDQELEQYDFNENITYLATEEGQVKGVCSLMLTMYFTKGHKGRFRIFHCETEDSKDYQELFERVLKEVQGVTDLFIFLKEQNQKVRNIFNELGFEIERYSYLLLKTDEPNKSNFDENYSVRPFVFDQDEKVYCHVLNTSFKYLNGHISDITEERIQKLQEEKEHLPEGMLLLCKKDEVVGIVRITDDEYKEEKCAYLGPIAILPSEQGKGLGRNLLRYALEISQKLGYTQTILSVNGENEKAATLYLDEGFKKEEVVVCYNYSIRGEI